MKPITSREYKVMLNHLMFRDLENDRQQFSLELASRIELLALEVSGNFEKVKRRKVRFLDTRGQEFRRNNLVLRHRIEKGKPGLGTLTLKSRFEDRYVSANIDLSPSVDFEIESEKFEEDIAPPFRSRYSSSVVVANPAKKLPATLSQASKVFPILGHARDGKSDLRKSTAVATVGGFVAHETVLTGVEITLPNDVRCTLAVIFWSHSWKSRIICAEVSFRYRNKKEKYLPETTRAAFDLFTSIQKLGWCMTNGITKTQAAYRFANSSIL